MDSKVQKQIKRFLELSLKFSKKEEDLFEERADTGHLLTASTSFGSNVTGYSVINTEPKTRGKVIREAAEAKAKLSDEFDEYLRLRSLLNEYFNVVDKLKEK